MLDAEAAEWSACRSAFGDRTTVLMCYFHVMYNVRKFLKSGGYDAGLCSSRILIFTLEY
jgi:hypothetical protein